MKYLPHHASNYHDGKYNIMWYNISFPKFIFNIGFPANFRHLIKFHHFLIHFRPEKLTAFKSKVQFFQIVIHIRFFSINFKNSALKFVNCH